MKYSTTLNFILADSIDLKNQTGFFLLIFILFAVFIIAFVIVVARLRKNYEERRLDLMVQLKVSKKENEQLENRVKKLEEKLNKEEKEWGEWQSDKEKLTLELLEIRKQLQKNSKMENESPGDIIIEYYMNNNSK